MAVALPESWQPPSNVYPGELADPVASAKAAGLRYVSDMMPGIRRKRSGEAFTYEDAEGNPVEDESTLRRIKGLVIPPAWTDVWICASPLGHLQATGRDARKRKQYRYHERWRQVRDAVKYDRMLAFAEALPKIRERTDRDLELSGMPREKVLATVVRLLEETRIRVGNEEYVKENGSFGLTTLRNRHVNVVGSEVRFKFKGKSGKHHDVHLQDRRLARIIKRFLDVPGQELFQYIDEDGEHHAVESSDVNDYIGEITGDDFTAKDFRTWAGTLLAACALRDLARFESASEAKRNVVAAIDEVARKLGHTRAICRRAYVHPVVIETYLGGALDSALDRERAMDGRRLRADEAAVLALLKRSARMQASRRAPRAA